jgi:cytochrome P450
MSTPLPTPPDGHPPIHFDIHDPAFVRDSGWIDRMFNMKDREGGKKAASEFGNYIDRLITSRRAKPTDDFVSKLIASEVEGHRLTDKEIHLETRTIGKCSTNSYTVTQFNNYT